MLDADHIGRIQTPRSRMRVAVKPSNVVMRFLPSENLLVVGNSWKEKTLYSSSANSPEKQPCARLFLNDRRDIGEEAQVFGHSGRRVVLGRHVPVGPPDPLAAADRVAISIVPGIDDPEAAGGLEVDSALEQAAG